MNTTDKQAAEIGETSLAGQADRLVSVLTAANCSWGKPLLAHAGDCACGAEFAPFARRLLMGEILGMSWRAEHRSFKCPSCGSRDADEMGCEGCGAGDVSSPPGEGSGV